MSEATEIAGPVVTIPEVLPGWHLMTGPLPLLAREHRKTPPWTPAWVGQHYRVRQTDGSWSWITHSPGITAKAAADFVCLVKSGFCVQLCLEPAAARRMTVVITEATT